MFMFEQANDISPEFMTDICSAYNKYNQIDPSAFNNEHVKRGLRNADGSGVLAGITNIGSVLGYTMSEGERIPREGKLYYRGMEIEDLVNGFVKEDRFGFEETIYLLLFGGLPNTAELEAFNKEMADIRVLPQGFTEDMILKAPSPDVMNKIARCVLALYSYDTAPDVTSLPNMLRQSMLLVARIPTIVAHAYAVKRHYYNHESLFLHHPQDNLTMAENFLHSFRPDSKYTAEEARLLDICMVLHAEHGGGNNSAFTARVLSSSGTDTYSAIAAAVGSLKGPKHGGANAKVMKMFDDIQRHVKDWKDDEEVASYLGKMIRREAGDGSGLIYGMGHAVYTMSDPRAIILKKYAESLAEKKGMLDELLLIETVERLSPEVFAKVKGDSKVISANVDMYSGMVYKMLDIPPDLYTPIFAISRTVGWCAHRIEEVLYGGRIIRPAYRALVHNARYIPLKERG